MYKMGLKSIKKMVGLSGNMSVLWNFLRKESVPYILQNG